MQTYLSAYAVCLQTSVICTDTAYVIRIVGNLIEMQKLNKNA